MELCRQVSAATGLAIAELAYQYSDERIDVISESK